MKLVPPSLLFIWLVLLVSFPAGAAIKTVKVFACNGGGETAIANTAGSLGGNDSRLVPHCGSGGTWESFSYDDEFVNPTSVNFELIGITSENIALAFAFGFGAITLLWSLGYAIAAGITVIKKL